MYPPQGPRAEELAGLAKLKSYGLGWGGWGWGLGHVCVTSILSHAAGTGPRPARVQTRVAPSPRGTRPADRKTVEHEQRNSPRAAARPTRAQGYKTPGWG